eukprot:scaffold75866_cov63-Phaeocystis_antarctica.AAC.3
MVFGLPPSRRDQGQRHGRGVAGLARHWRRHGGRGGRRLPVAAGRLTAGGGEFLGRAPLHALLGSGAAAAEGATPARHRARVGPVTVTVRRCARPGRRGVQHVMPVVEQRGRRGQRVGRDRVHAHAGAHLLVVLLVGVALLPALGLLLLHVRHERRRLHLEHLLDGGVDVDALQQREHTLAQQRAVGAGLGDEVQPQRAALPHAVLAQQVGHEEQQPAVVLDPPDVDRARLQLVVGGEVAHVVAAEQGLAPQRGLLHHRHELGHEACGLGLPPPRPAHQDGVGRERAEAGALDGV